VNRSAATFRADIEGLRGLAVLLVVLFHAGVPWVGGGFVGVDAFFVISGFLITGLLLRERLDTGRIRVTAFYARRVRRLLPAAAVVLVATLVASSRWTAPLDRPGVALDAASAALSIGNVRFALAAGDYFASVAAPSPFLHFWSLGVEEQFYLVWPALLLVAGRLLPWPRLGTFAALVAVSGASLAAAVVLTDGAPNWAFYSLPTRAWELGLGGLLAIAAPSLAGIPSPIRSLASVLGIGALVGAAVLLDASTAFPGTAALAPTLGVAAIILGRGAGPSILLATAPFRWLGRISYSLYLWHWPLLVLGPLALGVDPDVGLNLALAAVAVAIATVSWAVVEEPFRRGIPVLTAQPRRTLATGLAAIVVLTTLSGGLATATVTASGDRPAPLAATRSIPPRVPARSATVTRCPRSAATRAHSIPATPPPTTSTSVGGGARSVQSGSSHS